MKPQMVHTCISIFYLYITYYVIAVTTVHLATICSVTFMSFSFEFNDIKFLIVHAYLSVWYVLYIKF